MELKDKQKQIAELRKKFNYHKKRCLRISIYPKSDNPKIVINRAIKVFHHYYSMIVKQ